eukprot:tig00000194_g14832.t1
MPSYSLRDVHYYHSLIPFWGTTLGPPWSPRLQARHLLPPCPPPLRPLVAVCSMYAYFIPLRFEYFDLIGGPGRAGLNATPPHLRVDLGLSNGISLALTSVIALATGYPREREASRRYAAIYARLATVALGAGTGGAGARARDRGAGRGRRGTSAADGAAVTPAELQLAGGDVDRLAARRLSTESAAEPPPGEPRARRWLRKITLAFPDPEEEEGYRRHATALAVVAAETACLGLIAVLPGGRRNKTPDDGAIWWSLVILSDAVPLTMVTLRVRFAWALGALACCLVPFASAALLADRGARIISIFAPFTGLAVAACRDSERERRQLWRELVAEAAALRTAAAAARASPGAEGEGEGGPSEASGSSGRGGTGGPLNFRKFDSRIKVASLNLAIAEMQAEAVSGGGSGRASRASRASSSNAPHVHGQRPDSGTGAGAGVHVHAHALQLQQ